MAIEAGEQHDLVEITTQIVTAYAAGNHLPVAELPGLIRGVHASLRGLTSVNAKAAEKQRVLTPAEIRRSIQRDGLISFEDGKAYKTLRRHLARLGLTPEAYRAKWGLPVDYPMTASAYSAQRSQLARDLGLGRPRGAGSRSVASVFEGPVADSEGEPADDGSPPLQMAAEAPENGDTANEFDRKITRDPSVEDG
ncbi:MucR family transcriptional regulator [Methylobacterium sp. Leaf87]|uniref:MucR family transcriptional regulator n=1 Tax=Methylobacterium sp. Leaf87 TaxID=1736243 RepID=UPI0009EA6FC3|nr:MucR family transcriptional regulator [Methylobacterium sp. Leaf87]